MEGGIHALTSFGLEEAASVISSKYEIASKVTYTVRMAAITTQKDSMIYSVLLCNALPNGVDRIPLDTIPLNVVGLQDPLRGRLHLVLSSLLARIKVLVRRSRNLDI